MGRSIPEIWIFAEDAAKQRYLRDVGLSIRKAAAELYAYCVMSNHYHFLIGTDRVPIGQIMQAPNSHIAQRWNWEHDRKGPIWDDRFKSP
ncbi:MAG: transposase, partial [Elusimicrobia bacterium]|nr:transposase [Elusimicrobiota bacterium]